MPTDVMRRGGKYPVRLSLNIPESTSRLLDRWELRTGRSRGELARAALELGLPLLTVGLAGSAGVRGAPGGPPAAAAPPADGGGGRGPDPAV